jgi:hypothetical protein
MHRDDMGEFPITASTREMAPGAAFQSGRLGAIGLLGAALALAGCGDNSGGSPAADSDSAPFAFNVDGRGGSDTTSGVMQVWENEPIVELSLQGMDAAGNQVLFYVTFTEGVESVPGEHTLDIGLPGETNVMGIGILDDQLYYSLRGQLKLAMSGSGDARAEGEFGMDLAFDDGSGPPPGVASEAIESALSLSGSFTSEWTVDCRTRFIGFTGGHYTHDSPYCLGLTF